MMHALRATLALLLLSGGASARQVTVTVLATTDMHGNLYAVDYFTGKPAARGLAKIATLVRQVRREKPDALLFDCGDTIQGSPLESVWQHYVSTGRLPLRLTFANPRPRQDPMMAAMNQLGYAAMVVGNHEFNFGLRNLDRARREARFPWLSANTLTESGSKHEPFAPYLVRTVDGVRVAIIGLTTPAVPTWEQPDHYQGYRFIDPKQAAEQALADLRRTVHPDLVIAGFHAGLGRLERTPSESHENGVLRLASEVRGIDAIVFGHTHQQLAGDLYNGVLLVQPKNWAASLARLDFTLDDASGSWKVVHKTSRLLAVTPETEPDAVLLALGRPYHDLTERYLNSPVAESLVEMDGRTGRFADTPLVDAIQAVQLSAAKADVSFTALFHTGVHIPKGGVTVRQMAALYVYDNELYAIEGDGKMVKAALENAARYFRSCPDPACSHGPLVSRNAAGFNYDMAEGVEYEIDLTRPEGHRIINLRRNGRPLDPDEKIRIAVNNYRAAGSGGYSMFRGARVLWQSSEDIRSLIIDYYTRRGALPARATGNWRIVPPQALQILEREKPE